VIDLWIDGFNQGDLFNPKSLFKKEFF